MSFLDLLKNPATLAVIGTIAVGSGVGYIVIERPSTSVPNDQAPASTTSPNTATTTQESKTPLIVPPRAFRVEVNGKAFRPSLTPGEKGKEIPVSTTFFCDWYYAGNSTCQSPDLAKEIFGATISMRYDPQYPDMLTVKGFYGDMEGRRYTWEELKKGINVSGMHVVAK